MYIYIYLKLTQYCKSAVFQDKIKIKFDRGKKKNRKRPQWAGL